MLQFAGEHAWVEDGFAPLLEALSKSLHPQLSCEVALQNTVNLLFSILHHFQYVISILEYVWFVFLSLYLIKVSVANIFLVLICLCCKYDIGDIFLKVGFHIKTLKSKYNPFFLLNYYSLSPPVIITFFRFTAANSFSCVLVLFPHSIFFVTIVLNLVHQI